jgi:hypothetical protein
MHFGVFCIFPRNSTFQKCTSRVDGSVFHIPSDLVVDQWVSNVESRSPHDFLLLHDLWTTFRHLLWSQITSVISTAWDFTTKSGGIWKTLGWNRFLLKRIGEIERRQKRYLREQEKKEKEQRRLARLKLKAQGEVAAKRAQAQPEQKHIFPSTKPM